MTNNDCASCWLLTLCALSTIELCPFLFPSGRFLQYVAAAFSVGYRFMLLFYSTHLLALDIDTPDTYSQYTRVTRNTLHSIYSRTLWKAIVSDISNYLSSAIVRTYEYRTSRAWLLYAFPNIFSLSYTAHAVVGYILYPKCGNKI